MEQASRSGGLAFLAGPLHQEWQHQSSVEKPLKRSNLEDTNRPSPTRIHHRLLAVLPANAFDRNTAIGAFLMGALPAAAGSAVSIVLNFAFLWAVLSLAARRFPFRMTAGDKTLATALSIYAVSIVATALLSERYAGLPSMTYWLLPYFSGWFLISRLRASPGLDHLFNFCLGASVGAIAACLVGIAQLLAGMLRPEAFTGNAAVYGVTCLSLGCFSALNITSANAVARRLAAAGLLAGLLGMLLSQTRGTWLAAVPALGMVFAYAPAQWMQLPKGRRAAWLSVVGLVASLTAAETVWNRLEYTSSELETIFADDDPSSTSLGGRLTLWEASIPTIAASPIWGYGVQNRMLAIQYFYSSLDGGLSSLSHPHNLVLTAFLDGGIIVATALFALLAAPIVVAWDTRHSEEGQKRLYFAMILVGIYVVNGMTQIMFKHDIMDSLFIYVVLIVAVSDKGGKRLARSRPTAGV